MGEAKQIPLTQGLVAIVDAADYDQLAEWKWHADWNRYTRSFYAVRNVVLEDGRRRIVSMHRAVMGLERGCGTQVDHIDRNTLDNRRSNLRKASASENARNRGAQRNNQSGLKGVYLEKHRALWRARIFIQGKQICLGFHRSPQEAHAAYCHAAQIHHGEFANGGR